MLPDVHITCHEGLPLPPTCPETTSSLASLYLEQLREAVTRGDTVVTLTVFQWPQSSWPPLSGAYAVLRIAVDFLYNHSQIQHLELCCAGQDCYRSYQFQWNLWFAERKPEHMETVTDL